MKFNPQLFVGINDQYIYTDEEIILKKGSKLFLYTDGVTEAENTSKELYGEERLSEVLSANTSSDVRATVNTVVQSISNHVQDAETSDDLTILLIHYEPENPTIK